MRQSKSLTDYKKVCSIVLTFSLVTITVVGALLAVLSSVANVDDGTSFAEQGPAQMIKPDEDIRVRASDAYGKLPLHFETNRGQSDPQVRFLARASRESLFLTPTEAVLTLTKRESPEAPTHGTPEPRGPRTGTVLRMTFAGANPTPRMIGLEELPGNSNYFLGNDSAKWRTHVPTYAKVRYNDLYPGVDLIYYGTQRQLEYDFVVRAGADPTRILLGFKGAERQEVDDQGDLVLHTAAGPIRQRKPVVYQEIDGARQEVAGGYVLTATHQVSFRIGAYDTSRPLIIDPVLVYSSYLSGGDTDEGQGIAVDSAGNAYVTGFTQSTNFPTVAGAFQPTSGGGAQDAFVTKLDPAGSAIVYSTYLGGSDVDNGSEIAVDAAGNAYVTGFTQSTNFPTTAGALETSFGGSYDAFVTKISSDGSALVCSTYLGGSSVEFGIGIAVDALGNAYVTGWSNSDDFSTTAGAFQTSLGGGPHTFVTKLDPAGSPLYSTFLGDTVANLGLGIAVDAAGNAYVTGGALSTSFPTTVGAFQTTFGGGFEDAYVTKLNPTGSALVYSTYLGGSDTDHTFGIAVDAAGNAYVTGYTKSANFPTTAGAFQPTFGGGPQDAFVTKLDPTGSTLVYSTYLGGSDFDSGFAIAVDALDNADVTGFTYSTNFPTMAGAFQPTFGGGVDAFVTKFNPIGSTLYSTYLGGYSLDYGLRIAVDAAGDAYVTGFTISGNFPTTAGAFQTTFGGSYEAFVAKITEAVPPPSVGRVTGGGTINIPGGTANFGFVVQAQSTTGPIGGSLQYVNQASGARLHSVTFDSLVIAGNSATFGGTCTNNGAPCTFTAKVQDNGATGTNDSFAITVDAGPPEGANENLRIGNVLIH